MEYPGFTRREILTLAHRRSLQESDPSRQEVAGGSQGLGLGGGEVVFNGGKVSIWEDEKALETDGGDGCTIMQMQLVGCI